MNPYQTPAETERSQALRNWLLPWMGAAETGLIPVAGDASFRRYFRIEAAQSKTGSSLILMDAPPELECPQRFLELADRWHQRGVRVPGILQADVQLGAVLLEDFGDRQLLGCLNATDPVTADPLYRQALIQLAQLQQSTQDSGPQLPTYDASLLAREMDLFDDWLLGQWLELTPEQRPDNWQAFQQQLIASALEQPKVTVHRDYHSRNLMLLADQQLGILDFQDAVWGPCTYDAVSLIRDCYIQWPAEWQAQWLQFAYQLHCQHFDPVSLSDYSRWFDRMGMQRHLKAAGIFARLWLRDGKQGYLKDIPRSLQHLQQALKSDPEFADISDWLTRQVAPTLAEKLNKMA